VNKAGNILSPAIKKLQVMEHRFLWVEIVYSLKKLKLLSWWA